VEFPDGKSEDLGQPKRTRVFSDGVAYEVTTTLKFAWGTAMAATVLHRGEDCGATASHSLSDPHSSASTCEKAM